MTANKIVITRDNKLAHLLWLYREDEVELAALRYLDGSIPDGDAAIDREARICKHRVKTRKVLVGRDGRTGEHYHVERGLRRATAYNLLVAGINSELRIWQGVPVEIADTGQSGRVSEVDFDEGLLYVDTFEFETIICLPTDVVPVTPKATVSDCETAAGQRHGEESEKSLGQSCC